MKALLVLPTYNEAFTLGEVLEKVLGLDLADVLIVDDNSTDGTGDIIRRWRERSGRVHLLERPGKLGLGTAYVAGFRWGLERGYECFIEMDADLSHNPFNLPRFVQQMERGADLVIGSRYMGGTISVVGWDFRRLLLSRLGNSYATWILGFPLTDVTSGFRAFSRRALEAMDLEGIHAQGYSFQIEMAYYVWRMGMEVREIPITFTERYGGASKMSRAIVREAMRLPWTLRWRSLTGGLKRALGLTKRPLPGKEDRRASL
jgi:dolichol-phosphate mannosyltransferase